MKEVKEVKDNKKVKSNSGLPFGAEVTLKVLAGLYLIGLLMKINEIIMRFISPLMMSVGDSQFMMAELVPFADFIFSPVRTMVWILPMLIPVVIMSTLLVFGLSKLRFVSNKDLKVFTLVLAVIFIITA